MTNRTFMTVEEVAAELGVSKSYAYKIVKQLNEELQKLGYLTVAGRVNTYRSVQDFLKDFKASQTEYSEYRTAIAK